jgi:hypothetical protein
MDLSANDPIKPMNRNVRYAGRLGVKRVVIAKMASANMNTIATVESNRSVERSVIAGLSVDV